MEPARSDICGSVSDGPGAGSEGFAQHVKKVLGKERGQLEALKEAMGWMAVSEVRDGWKLEQQEKQGCDRGDGAGGGSFHGFKHMKTSFSFLTWEDRRGVSQTQTSLEMRLGR